MTKHVKYQYDFTVETGRIETNFPFFTAEDLMDAIIKYATSRGCIVAGGFFVEKDEDKSDEQKDAKSM